MALLLAGTLCACGCRTHEPNVAIDPHVAYFQSQAREVEYPDVVAPPSVETLDTPPPWLLSSGGPPPFREITLQEAVQTALARSPVLRDVGGLVLQTPGALQTTFTPAITETDPRFGVDAALSAFDAQLSAGAYFEKNDRAFNNAIAGLGTQTFRQDLNNYNIELRKRTAAGTILAARGRFDYDFNNSPFNNVPNLPWTMRLEGELRQPLLQGAGVDFNRIAGPANIPGFYNGVLISRINTDISTADFEAAVVQLVSQVENAYWELYFAYRDLDAKILARQQAFETWQQVSVLFRRGPGGQLEATAEAQAREQLYRLEAEVQDAKVGKQQEKSNTNIFRGTGGVYASERRLRRVMGIPASDGTLLRPANEPTIARTLFVWEEVLSESLVRRVELRRQKWQVKRRELELIAARNYLLPRLDAVGLYRFRGLGHDLVGNADQQFGSALSDLVTGDFQEWALGVEMTAPVGFRQGHAAVRNAELQVSREQAVLDEQERQVVADLSSVVGELDRAYELARTSFNRKMAAQRQLDTTSALLLQADDIDKPRLLDLKLDAQRRLADAESQYHRSLAEHEVAIKNMHLEKGSLLEYNRIYLSEGMWPGKAYRDAARREKLRITLPRLDNYVRDDRIVSQGPYAQEFLPPTGEELPPSQPKPAEGAAPEPLLPAPLPAPLSSE
ncbi:MAG TPA: TolC family protein [Pirellulaceae bacterium]|nr:TolC family protein [Pirellulaceae bacterium]